MLHALRRSVARRGNGKGRAQLLAELGACASGAGSAERCESRNGLLQALARQLAPSACRLGQAEMTGPRAAALKPELLREELGSQPAAASRQAAARRTPAAR